MLGSLLDTILTTAFAASSPPERRSAPLPPARRAGTPGSRPAHRDCGRAADRWHLRSRTPPDSPFPTHGTWPGLRSSAARLAAGTRLSHRPWIFPPDQPCRSESLPSATRTMQKLLPPVSCCPVAWLSGCDLVWCHAARHRVGVVALVWAPEFGDEPAQSGWDDARDRYAHPYGDLPGQPARRLRIQPAPAAGHHPASPRRPRRRRAWPPAVSTACSRCPESRQRDTPFIAPSPSCARQGNRRTTTSATVLTAPRPPAGSPSGRSRRPARILMVPLRPDDGGRSSFRRTAITGN